MIIFVQNRSGTWQGVLKKKPYKLDAVKVISPLPIDLCLMCSDLLCCSISQENRNLGDFSCVKATTLVENPFSVLLLSPIIKHVFSFEGWVGGWLSGGFPLLSLNTPYYLIQTYNSTV